MAIKQQKINTITTSSDILGVEPEVILELSDVSVEVPAEETPEPSPIVFVEAPVEKRVKVRTKTSFKQYIGNQWYYFTAGEVITVTPNVRDILFAQGALDVLP